MERHVLAFAKHHKFPKCLFVSGIYRFMSFAKDTHVQKFSKLFGILSAYSYLCSRLNQN